MYYLKVCSYRSKVEKNDSTPRPKHNSDEVQEIFGFILHFKRGKLGCIITQLNKAQPGLRSEVVCGYQPASQPASQPSCAVQDSCCFLDILNFLIEVIAARSCLQPFSIRGQNSILILN